MELRRHIAYEAIRSKILSGEYAPGSTLSEVELGQALGTSRTPVREALLRLQEEGLASILPRRGAMVRILTVTEIREILVVREALEAAAAALAALRMPREQLQALRAEWQGVFDTLSESSLQALDKQGVEFHGGIIDASDNRTLARMLETIRGRIEGTRQVYLKTSGEAAVRRARITCEEHLRIIAALEARDPQRAEAEMKAHLRQIRAETLGSVE